MQYPPGSLVRARQRDWVVEPNSKPDFLHLRPLAGSTYEEAHICPQIEPVESASFPLPQADSLGNMAQNKLLQSAMRLGLRAGAGPFRSFGNIGVQPRIYQLVPLIMALKLQTIRLLIADDVGVGKTIEAGLILRELIDRAEVDRFCVLCPPNLSEQWKSELMEHFHLDACLVTPSTVKHLESKLPPNTSIFSHHPYTIVSLDYIKSDRHLSAFIAHAPDLLVVDEAHTCTSAGKGHHKRFELLNTLAAEPKRHILLLTATPHSGVDENFYRLLSLIDSKYGRFEELKQNERKNMRNALAKHVVQRRRKDIEEWAKDYENQFFPKRLVAEVSYRLKGKWGDFFDETLESCREFALAREMQGQQFSWYAALALMRCMGSSPASALSALKTRLQNSQLQEPTLLSEQEFEIEILDKQNEQLSSDLEPVLAQSMDNEQARLRFLISKCEHLMSSEQDPKLKCLLKQCEQLIAEGHHPIIFCQYVATAHYLKDALRKHLKKSYRSGEIVAITGLLAPDERKEQIDMINAQKQRILIATNCLSEGINLQDGFDSVIHYDLAWNPTRHEQREGRVDRFGQKAKEVKCLLMYAEDSPIDGMILDVILRKAKRIREALGVHVSMPENEDVLSRALVKGVLMRRYNVQDCKITPYLPGFEELSSIDVAWQNALDKAKKSSTTFAQNTLRPEEVIPEWQLQAAQLGTEDELKSFLLAACQHLGVNLEKKRDYYKFDCQHFPEELRTQWASKGIKGRLKLSFKLNPDYTHIQRSHPIITNLAEYLSQASIEMKSGLLPRSSVTMIAMSELPKPVRILFLRLRHQLHFTFGQNQKHIMAEEAIMIIQLGDEPYRILEQEEWARYQQMSPIMNVHAKFGESLVEHALEYFQQESTQLQAIADQRACKLLEDHLRVREASRIDAGKVSIESFLPMDLIALSILQPTI